MNSEQKYWAFISYSHKDSSVANRLETFLAGYRAPRELRGRRTSTCTIPDHKLKDIFLDREELGVSTDLSSEIKSALLKSHSLVVVCSPNAAKSKWVAREINFFASHKPLERIHCLIADGDPDCDNGSDCLPEALKKLGITEPLASDARGGNSTFRDACLRIVAGVLGVGFDELRKRHARRAFRKKVVWALSICCLSSVLCFTFITSRLNRDLAKSSDIVKGLTSCTWSEFQNHLKLARKHWNSVQSLLVDVSENGNSPAKSRSVLALASVHPEEWTHTAVQLVTEDNGLALSAYATHLDMQLAAPILWEAVQSNSSTQNVANCALLLTRFDPENPRWGSDSGKICGALIELSHQNSNYSTLSNEWLNPVAEELAPEFGEVFLDGSRIRSERNAAFRILTAITSDPDLLVSILVRYEGKELSRLIETLHALENPKSVDLLLRKVVAEEIEQPEDAPELDDYASRCANAILARIRLNATGIPWPKNYVSANFTEYFLGRLRAAEIRFDDLYKYRAQLLSKQTKKWELLCLIKALALNLETAQEQSIENLASDLQIVVGERSDVEILMTCNWLLGKLSSEDQANHLVLSSSPLPQRVANWSVAPDGTAMLTFDAPQNASYRFAAAVHEVTVNQWADYLRASGQQALQASSSSGNHPITRLSWYQAAEYCNWLSNKAGIDESEWCYHTNGLGEYGEMMDKVNHVANYTGYRLLTETEWQQISGRGNGSLAKVRAQRLPRWQHDVLRDVLEATSSNSRSQLQEICKYPANCFGVFDAGGNADEWLHDDTGLQFSVKAETTIKGALARFLPGLGFDPRRDFAEVEFSQEAVKRGERTTFVRNDVHHKATDASSVREQYGGCIGLLPREKLARIGFRIARTVNPSRRDIVSLQDGKTASIDKGLTAEQLLEAAHKSLPQKPQVAVQLLELASAVKSDNESVLFELAVLQLHLGKLKDHGLTCQKMLEIAGSETASFSFLERTAKSCLLVPKGPYDVDEVLKLAQKAQQEALRRYPQNRRFIGFFDLTLAVAQFRNGFDREAVDTAARSLEYKGKRDLSWDAGAYAVLSLAHFRLANTSDAEQFCKLAAEALADSREDAQVTPKHWLKHLRSTILVNEARQNLEGTK